MKTFFRLIIISIFLYSCDKNNIEVSPNAKVKTKYIYSSSTDLEPYSFTSYTYDHNWNLTKELISDYPKPVTSSYTYKYDSDGRLLIKKYNSINGYNHSNQTETAFSVIREYKYQYIDDLQIELIYKKGELYDSVIYKNYNDLVLEEHHFNQSRGTEWSIINEYDPDGNLLKKSELPDNIYTTYLYENSKIIKSNIYSSDNLLVVENTYSYTKSRDKEIVEIHYKGPYGEFISEKTTYNRGSIIEFIKYHPTFIGSEWYCHRFEYY